MEDMEELTLNNTNNIIIKKNEKSNFNDARCSINALKGNEENKLEHLIEVLHL